ncbi:MAG TPA: hypothetical protein VMV90_14725 [Rectinemataceae bacterium]|nr:hypothetical protein [Rectinemataceae bacterium]
MKRSRFAILLAVLFGGLALGTAAAAPDGAVLLGERTVDFRANHDLIRVGHHEGFFRSLVFEVQRNNIEIFNIVVTYGDGRRERLDTRMAFDSGTRSREIRLEGGRRKIQSIAFEFRTLGSRIEGRARVRVFGLR